MTNASGLLRLCAVILAFAGLAGTANAEASGAGAGAAPSAAPHVTTSYGYSLYSDMRYPANFDHFDFVNPNAPKGGTIHLAGNSTYDSFNTFALRGSSALNIFNYMLVYDSLMKPAFDGSSAQYCELCESVSYPDDYSWVEYKLRKIGRWHDGTPITPEDVVYSFNMISQHAAPVWSSGLSNVAKAEVTGPWTVKFTFKTPGDRRQAYYLGFMLIIPKHYWEKHDFEAPIVTPPLTSGPYQVTGFELGRSFTLERVKNYWGRDLAVNRGQFNYDKIVTDYYRDSLVSFEAFKAGDFDVRVESSPKDWETGYVWPAAQKHEVVKTVLFNQSSAIYEGFFFNMRRPLFQDPVLRRALAYGVDFAWLNKNIYYGQFVRLKSIFAGSDLGATGLPGPDELKLLEPFRGKVPPQVFTAAYAPPSTDGTDESLRNNLRIAAKMLHDAGYVVKNGKLISPRTKAPVDFELTMWDPTFEPAASQWANNLRLLGITVRLKVMDFAQFTSRMENFDYDSTIEFIPFLPTPGMEIRNLWGTKAADTPGSFNWAGIKDPVIDALSEDIIDAKTRPELIAATRALDRVMMWNYYTLPLYSTGGKLDVAYWDRFGRPEHDLTIGFAWQTSWWIDPKKDAALTAERGVTN